MRPAIFHSCCQLQLDVGKSEVDFLPRAIFLFFVEIFAVRRCNEPGMARKLFFETKPHMMLNQRVAIVLKNVRNASLIAEIEDFFNGKAYGEFS